MYLLIANYILTTFESNPATKTVVFPISIGFSGLVAASDAAGATGIFRGFCIASLLKTLEISRQNIAINSLRVFVPQNVNVHVLAVALRENNRDVCDYSKNKSR